MGITDYERGQHECNGELDKSQHHVCGGPVEQNKVTEENEALKTQVKKLKNKLSQMQNEINNLKKYNRKNDILIQGIPCSEEEDVRDILRSLGTSVGMQIHD